MSKRRNSKREQRRRERRKREQQKQEEMLDEVLAKVSMLCLFVEAAGSWDRAKPIITSTGEFSAEDVAAMEQLVPTFRGGANDDPEFGNLWREIVERELASEDGREVFRQVQETLAA